MKPPRSLLVSFLLGTASLACTEETGDAGATGATSGTGGSGLGGDSSSGGAPSGGMSSSGGSSTTDDFAQSSRAALDALHDYLEVPRAERPIFSEQGFASVPLTREDAREGQRLLWEDFAAHVRATRAEEVGATSDVWKSVEEGGHSLKYYQTSLGSQPERGWSLFLSMHGGGGTDPSVNDSQWESQLNLITAYGPRNAICVAPRAPGNTWDMWFTAPVDALFERLVTNLIVFAGVDPNRVYLTGYSAGGDGTYQLAPRMADHWAGAAMSAGHPNDASPLNLRNVPFAIHVGANDTAYDRHLRAGEWGAALDALHAADPAGYFAQWQVHAGKGHWMDLLEAVSIPFLEERARDPIPRRVVWRQAGVTKTRLYWLAVDPEDAQPGDVVRAEYEGQEVRLTEASGVSSLTVRLRDEMLSLDEPIVVEQEGRELFRGVPERNFSVIYRTLEERGDPELVFTSEVRVELPD